MKVLCFWMLDNVSFNYFFYRTRKSSCLIKSRPQPGYSTPPRDISMTNKNKDTEYAGKAVRCEGAGWVRLRLAVIGRLPKQRVIVTMVKSGNTCYRPQSPTVSERLSAFQHVVTVFLRHFFHKDLICGCLRSKNSSLLNSHLSPLSVLIFQL